MVCYKFWPMLNEWVLFIVTTSGDRLTIERYCDGYGNKWKKSSYGKGSVAYSDFMSDAIFLFNINDI